MADEFGLDAAAISFEDVKPPDNHQLHIVAKANIKATRLAHIEAMRVKEPVTFSQDVADELCERITSGETLVSICVDEHMPSAKAVYDWAVKFPDFGRQYALARRRQAATIADVVMEEAMNALGNEGVAQARIVLDAGKWLASKLDPLGFGERAAPERASLNIADMSESDLEGLMATLEHEKAMRRVAKPAIEHAKPGTDEPDPQS